MPEPEPEQANHTLVLARAPIPPSVKRQASINDWKHNIVQEIAHMAILDGATHPELAQMAACGNWGETPGNAHNNVMANFCHDIKLSQPILIQVPVKDPKTSKDVVEDASLFLPHMLFSDLAMNYADQFQNDRCSVLCRYQGCG